MTPREQIAFLTGSEHRVRLLRTLQTPKRPCELDDEQPASRATIQRTLAGFEERGWVVKDGRTYRLTAAGDVVRQAYRTMASVVDAIDDAGVALTLFSGLGLPPAALTDATVTTATPTTPHAPLERYTAHVDRADPDRFRGVCPVLSDVINRAHAGIVEAGTPSELVIDEETFEAARQHAPEGVRLAEDQPSFSLYVHPDPIDYGLCILDDRVYVGAYDDQGQCRAIIDGTGDAFHEWAVAQFERCRDAAHVVETAV